jgi:hypothetical protein
MIDRRTANIVEYGNGTTNGIDLSVAVGHDADHCLLRKWFWVLGSGFKGSGDWFLVTGFWSLVIGH